MQRYCRGLLFFVLVVSTTWAQDADPAADHGGWKKYFQTVAAKYEITADGDSDPFKVTEKPVQSFFAGGPGEYNHGTFFVWSHLGQAKAIGELWCYGSVSRGAATTVHEMHSLSDRPFRARKSPDDKDDFWTPRQPGVKWQALPESYTAPKKTRGLRLAQMRSIARDFKGFAHRAKETEELRVPQHPIFRYEDNAKRKVVVDGAVFAFCAEWDPEILLVIEAHEQDDALKWYFAGARLCNVPLSLNIGEAELWRAGTTVFRNGALNKSTDPYYAVHGIASVKPEDLPDVEASAPVRPTP